jgi:hypothetical protein
MADLQNKDVMHQIRGMLEAIQKEDPQQAQIILNLLGEVVKEFNSGRTMNIERKLYDMIDGASYETKKK